MSSLKYKAAFRLFGVYFFGIFAICVLLSFSTIRASHQRLAQAQQAAIIAQLQELFLPEPIALQHEDITGIKSFVHKHREQVATRQERENRQSLAVATGILNTVAPAAAKLIPTNSNESTEFGDDTKSNKKFIPQDKDIQRIAVKYAQGLDSVARAQIREEIVALAKKHLGTRYVWAGRNPGGFDCSGFTSYMMSLFGITISPSSRHQALQGKRKPIKEAQVGDLIFFSRYGKGGRISHVALVVDNTPEGVHVIHATSRGIVVDNIHQSKYWIPKMLFASDVISM